MSLGLMSREFTVQALQTGVRRLNLFAVLIDRIADQLLKVIEPVRHRGMVRLACFRLTGQLGMG